MVKPADFEDYFERMMNVLEEMRDHLREISESLSRISEDSNGRVVHQEAQVRLPDIASEIELERAIEAAINESGATSLKDLGKAIKASRAHLKGKSFDENEVRDLLRRRLE